MVITRQDGGRGHSRSVSPSAASAASAGLTAALPAGLTAAAGAGPGLAGGPCAGTVTGACGDPGRSAGATPPPCPAIAGTCAGATLPGTGAAETAAVAGCPRVLTVPLPCASSCALTFRAFVSRETADSACFTRAGGSYRSPARDAGAHAWSGPALPAPPVPRGSPGPPRAAPAPRPVPRAAGGHPRPTAVSWNPSGAGPGEAPAGSSGHPKASGEGISARSSQASPAAAKPILVFPGRSCQPASTGPAAGH